MAVSVTKNLVKSQVLFRQCSIDIQINLDVRQNKKIDPLDVLPLRLLMDFLYIRKKNKAIFAIQKNVLQ